jgi:molybdenum cofactor cytidylyltransferase
VIAAIVLAAGASTRFGAQKLLAPLGGMTVVRSAVLRALHAGMDETIVVTGADAAAIRAALADLPVRVVVNANAAAGMSASLAAGVEACEPDTEAALVVLGDQPLVPPAAYAAVLAAWRAGGASIVAPRYTGGVRGHPVLFAADVFAELRALRGDVGARAVIERDERRVTIVDVAVAAPVDVDEPAALAALAALGTQA